MFTDVLNIQEKMYHGFTKRIVHARWRADEYRFWDRKLAKL